MNKRGLMEVEWVILIVTICLIIALFVPIIIKYNFVAPTEAKLYNAKYGTKYTASDFFWSGDTIKSFLQGGEQATQNINISGAIPIKITTDKTNNGE